MENDEALFSLLFRMIELGVAILAAISLISGFIALCAGVYLIGALYVIIFIACIRFTNDFTKDDFGEEDEL
jgi:FtsH-binding integral membrane protein